MNPGERAAAAVSGEARRTRGSMWRACARIFPILRQFVRGKPLVYLGNAATTQKPLAVIEALNHYYRLDNANIHRGLHTLNETRRGVQGARRAVRGFITSIDQKSYSCAAPLRGDQSRWLKPGAGPNAKQGDEILLSRWSTTRISYRGRCCAQQVDAKLKGHPNPRRRRIPPARSGLVHCPDSTYPARRHRAVFNAPGTIDWSAR